MAYTAKPDALRLDLTQGAAGTAEEPNFGAVRAYRDGADADQFAPPFILHKLSQSPRAPP